MSEPVPYILVALLDVLGYRDRLWRDRETGGFAFKEALQTAMAVLSSVNEAEYNYQAISDSIIITRNSADDLVGLLTILKAVQLAFLEQGLLIRGGVTYERHFKSNNITYSHALSIAHQLEKEVAIYPRIVVDHNVVEMYREKGLIGEVVKSELVCECNGVFFLNVLDETNWEGVYEAARTLFEGESTALRGHESEFLKHAWFETYLFSSQHAKRESLRFIPGPLLLTALGAHGHE